jgi:hypothetical protein
MKRKQSLLIALAVTLAVSITTTLTLAQGPTGTGPALAPLASTGTAFTYQGQLKHDGSPVNGACDFQFGLWDALSGGSLQGGIQTITNVSVVNGLFTTQPDFGSNAVNGEARWLEMTVRCPAGSGAYTPLRPILPLTPAPMALALNGLYTQQNATSPNVIGGYSGNVISATVKGGVIGGGGKSSYPNRVWLDYGTVGGGSGNTAGSAASTVAGGDRNTASGGLSVVGGGAQNTASGTYGTVAGGQLNIADGYLSTVGGGLANYATGYAATVPGGNNNSATVSYTLAAGRRAYSADVGTFVWADSTDASFPSTDANQFLIRANGGVGINTNAPVNNSLQVAKDFSSTGGYGQIEATGATNLTKRLTLGFDTTNNLGWIQASTTGVGYNDLALNPNGGSQANVMIGTTTDSGDKLTVLGDIRVGTEGTNGCIKRFDGTQLTGACLSDARLKQNVTAFPNVLDKVTQLRPVYYNWRAAEFPAYHFDGSTQSYGIIAQEVEQVLPELVGTDEQGYKTVNYSEIPLLLVQALKDLRAEKDGQIAAQQKEIEDLKARYAALDKKTAELETRLTALERQAGGANSTPDLQPVMLGLGALASLGFVYRERHTQRGER